MKLSCVAGLMSEEEIERKIAVIFATDVVGYSDAMELDEIQTLKNLKMSRKILDDLFSKHGGRVFNTAGDSVLAEFSSAVSAVVCAVEFQKLIKERNDTKTTGEKMEFRIGINMGDVVQEDGNLYGEGVNIAARLEALAKTNGVCISKNIHELINRKTQFNFSDLGEKKIKNTIVHAFNLSEGMEANSGDRPAGKNNKKIKEKGLIIFSVVALFILSFISYFGVLKKSTEPTMAPNNIIAVMPFTGTFGSENGDYFIDGVTEDLIVDLSKIKGLTLISANSVFQFKAKNYVDQEAAELLGANFLLKGNIRKKRDKLRVNIELVDGTDGSIIWADGIEKSESKIFEIEDEITFSVAKQLNLNVPKETQSRIETKSTTNLTAYDLYKQGLAHPDRLEARKLYKKAISQDPNFARAYASLAINIGLEMISLAATSRSDAELKIMKDEALSYAELSQQLDPDGAHGFLAEAIVLNSVRLFPQARVALDKALALEPNNVLAMTLYGSLDVNSGKYSEALIHLQDIRKLDPLFPIVVVAVETRSYLGLEKFEEALRSAEALLERNPQSRNGMIYYITAAWRLGNKDDALWQYEEYKLVSADDPFEMSLQKQPWDDKIKTLIYEVFKEIENS